MTRVLVVDDKDSNLYYLQALLSAQGYAVDTARHGAEALVLARQRPPSLIVADLLMPVMDGYTLLRHWRADALLRDIPFVVYTATYTEADDERLALELGADAFILKPAEPFEFLDRLQAVLRRPSLATAAGASATDDDLMVLYSQTLIRKLEEKTRQLELTNQLLEADIAERQRTEETLRISEANLAAAQRIAHFGSWELELGAERLDDNPLHWSDEMFRIAGLDPQSTAVSNQLFFERVPAFEHERIRTAMQAALQGGPAYALVHRMIRPDGDERVVHERAQLFLDEVTGTPLRMIGTTHDITEHHRADQALRASESLQRSLAAQLEAERGLRLDAQRVARIGSWETHVASGQVSWSEETHRIFETDPASFRPSHADFLERVHPEDRDRVAVAFEESLRHRSPCAIEHRLWMDDGRVKFVEERWQLSQTDGGEFRALGTCRDITEQRLAQVEIQRTAELLRAVADNIPDAVYVKDHAGRYLLFNSGASQLVGHAADAVLGRDDTALFTPAQAARVMAYDREVMRGGEAVTSEEVLTADGTTRTYLAVKAPYHDGNGEVLGLVGISRDITERTLMESALRKSEEELRLLTEIMPQIVWIGDASGTPLHINRQWQRYTGLHPDESSPDQVQATIHPDDRARVAAHWQESALTQVDFEVEYRLRDAGGGYRWMLGRALPLRDADGTVSKWFGTATDIDDLKRAAETVRTSEERFRLLSRVTKDAIWDWDIRSDALWWSEGFQHLFGHAGDAFGPSIQSWMERIHPDDEHRVNSGLQQAIDAGAENWADDYRFRRADGSYAQVADRGHVIRDELGRPLRMVGGMVDMSERLLLDEQLRQSQRLESLGQLTGGVAHDFNNLLTVILGNAELLAEQLADQPARQALAGMVVGAALRGAELTQRLLAFARKQALEPQPVDVNELLDGLDGLLRRTLGSQVDIRYSRDSALWPALVDPAQLENAVLNLCINARDAMPGGGWLSIETGHAHLDSVALDGDAKAGPGDYIMLAISDAGVGIAAQHLGRVFEPFFTTKHEGKGTGLGLAMVYGFVRQSGGVVRIDSEPGQGTTVTLYLPRAPDRALARRRPAPNRMIVGGDEIILLVEDDDGVRRHAVDQLRGFGYRVIDCGNGGEALAILREDTRIDLLFTDVAMPGLGGRQLADAALALRPALAVLYSSGYSDEAIVHQGRLDPGVQLLAKPYRQVDLAHALRRALDAGSGASARPVD